MGENFEEFSGGLPLIRVVLMYNVGESVYCLRTLVLAPASITNGERYQKLQQDLTQCTKPNVKTFPATGFGDRNTCDSFSSFSTPAGIEAVSRRRDIGARPLEKAHPLLSSHTPISITIGKRMCRIKRNHSSCCVSYGLE